MNNSWITKHAKYYLDIAKLVGNTRVRCHSRHIGSVLVKDDNIIATGFNGPPRGIPMCDEWEGNWTNSKIPLKILQTTEHPPVKGKCPRKVLGYPSGGGLEYCPAVHSERNTLLMCAKNGVSTKGSILYCWCGLPCKDCTIELIQAGIKGVVCATTEIYDTFSPILFAKSKTPVVAYSDKWYILRDGIFVPSNQEQASFEFDRCKLINK